MDDKRQKGLQKYRRIQRLVRVGATILALTLSIIAICQSCAVRRAVSDLEDKIQEGTEMPAAQTSEAEHDAENLTETCSVTLSFTGGCALATDEKAAYEGSFSQYYDLYGASYFFQNVRSLFVSDDLTTVSLESTLSKSGERRDQSTALRSDPSYVEILVSGGIDAASAANAHTHDYGEESYVDTLATLDNAGIHRFANDYTATVTLTASGSANENILVGLASVWEGSDFDFRTTALDAMETLENRGAQIIIVSIAWNESEQLQPDDSRIALAHSLIDAGADLIVGIQPGNIQGIECYHGKYILYSLGSFLGDNADLDSVIFQQTFVFSDGVCLENSDYTIIPCTSTSEDGTNIYCPTPASGDEAQRILNRVYDASSLLDGGIQPAAESTMDLT